MTALRNALLGVLLLCTSTSLIFAQTSTTTVVTSPGSGDKVKTSAAIRWRRSSVSGTYVALSLVCGTGSDSLYVITTRTGNDGAYSWYVRPTSSNTGYAYSGGECRIEVRPTGQYSDKYYSATFTLDIFTVTFPVGINRAPPTDSDLPAGVFSVGSAMPIRWTGGSTYSTVKVYLKANDGQSPSLTYFDQVPNNNGGQTEWTLPNKLQQGNYRVKVQASTSSSQYDLSDPFLILNPFSTVPPVVIHPSEQTVWKKNDRVAIFWSALGAYSKVKIRLYQGSTLKRTITSSTSNDGSYSLKVSWSHGSSNRLESGMTIQVESLGAIGVSSKVTSRSQPFSIDWRSSSSSSSSGNDGESANSVWRDMGYAITFTLSVNPANTAAQNDIETGFRSEIRSMTGLSGSRLSLTSVMAGSMVISYSVSASSCTSTSTSCTSVPANSAVTGLQRMMSGSRPSEGTPLALGSYTRSIIGFQALPTGPNSIAGSSSLPGGSNRETMEKAKSNMLKIIIAVPGVIGVFLFTCIAVVVIKCKKRAQNARGVTFKNPAQNFGGFRVELSAGIEEGTGGAGGSGMATAPAMDMGQAEIAFAEAGAGARVDGYGTGAVGGYGPAPQPPPAVMAINGMFAAMGLGDLAGHGAVPGMQGPAAPPPGYNPQAAAGYNPQAAGGYSYPQPPQQPPQGHAGMGIPLSRLDSLPDNPSCGNGAGAGGGGGGGGSDGSPPTYSRAIKPSVRPSSPPPPPYTGDHRKGNDGSPKKAYRYGAGAEFY